eukprot:Rmarinus@m.14238
MAIAFLREAKCHWSLRKRVGMHPQMLVHGVRCLRVSMMNTTILCTVTKSIVDVRVSAINATTFCTGKKLIVGVINTTAFCTRAKSIMDASRKEGNQVTGCLLIAMGGS